MYPMKALLVFVSLLVAGCTTGSISATRVTLVIPDSFRGEVFLVASPESAQDWAISEIVVPPSGIVPIKNLPGLVAIPPDHFRARYVSGERIGNSVLRTGKEVSLWPVSYVDDQLFYFVVGTFHEKTVYENQRMSMGWSDIIGSLKKKKSPHE